MSHSPLVGLSRPRCKSIRVRVSDHPHTPIIFPTGAGVSPQLCRATSRGNQSVLHTAKPWVDLMRRLRVPGEMPRLSMQTAISLRATYSGGGTVLQSCPSRLPFVRSSVQTHSKYIGFAKQPSLIAVLDTFGARVGPCAHEPSRLARAAPSTPLTAAAKPRGGLRGFRCAFCRLWYFDEKCCSYNKALAKLISYKLFSPEPISSPPQLHSLRMSDASHRTPP